MQHFILAQSSSKACDLIGCSIYTGDFKPDSTLNDQITQLIRFSFSFVFVLIILFGIVLIIKAAITIINSNGDDAKIEEGSKAIKGVFIGIIIIFVGVIGIILLITFFGATGALGNNVQAPKGVNIPFLTN